MPQRMVGQQGEKGYPTERIAKGDDALAGGAANGPVPRMPAFSHEHGSIRIALVMATGFAIIAILTIGLWAYQTQKNSVSSVIYANLHAVAELKADEILTWTSERLSDASVLQESPLFVKTVASWLASPNEDLAAELQAVCNSLRAHYHYRDVAIVDLSGKVRLNTATDMMAISPEERATMDASLSARRPVLSDLFMGEGESIGPELCVAAVLFSGDATSPEPICFILFRIDANNYLFPLLQSWPAPSSTAETLLVRRDGDSVLLLNELRKQQGTALKLRIPLEKTDVPAVQAVLGTTGLVTGVDYTGTPVLSAIYPVSSMPWFVIAKIDSREAFAAWLPKSISIITAISALLLFVIFAATAIHQRSNALVYRAQLAAEQAAYKERERATGLQAILAAIVDSADDAIIGERLDNTISAWNRGAERMFGYSAEEMLGQPVSLLIPENKRREKSEILARILAGDQAEQQETVRLRKNGTAVDVLLKVSPILDAAGQVVGISKILRDISEQRRIELAERKFNELRSAILDALPVHIALLDADGEVVTVNEGWRLFGRENALSNPNACVGTNYLDICDATSGEASKESTEAANGIRRVLSGEIKYFELEYTCHSPIAERWFQMRVFKYFELEYTCHSPIAERWFQMRVVPLQEGKEVGAVVMHVDVTKEKQAEDALKQSEEQYRMLFENLSAGAAICEVLFDDAGVPVDFVNLLVNKSHRLHSGMPTEKILGQRISDVLPAHEVAPLIAQYGAVALSGEVAQFEHFQPSLHRWFDITVYRIQKNRIAVLFQDITQRKEAEEALRKSEARYRALVENIPQHIMIKDVDSRYVSVNDVYAKRLGLPPESIIGKSDFELFPRELAEKYRSDDRQVMETSQTVEFDEEFDNHGTRSWIHTIKAPVRDEDGHITGVLVTFWDVTERRAAEEKLHLQGAVLEAAANAIVITDIQGNIEWANPAFTSLTGYTLEEAVGKNPRELVKSDVHEPAFYKHMWETILSGKVWQGELTNRRKDGSLYTEVQTITPVYDRSGALAHFVGIKLDISDRKKLEQELQQAQKMESVGHLAGGIAHDFNNLLTVISGYTEMALTLTKEGEPLHKDLTQVYKAAERAASLTRQLLAFSRKQVMKPEILDLNQVILDCTKMLTRLVGEDIEFLLKPESELWPVLADPGQIEQIVMNLVVNSRDAMPRGGRVVVETFNVDLDDDLSLRHNGMQRGRYVCLAVTDTGTGMDTATMEKIFEPFFTTKDIGKGTGLGLATVYGIVKQNGGNIYAYSEVGIGTTFKIYLPEANTEIQKGALPPDSNATVNGLETILLVEDEEPLRRLTERILASAGYTVIAAKDGADALAHVEQWQGPIHLLLTDVIMPGMSGRELFDRLHANGHDFKTLYVSGYTDTAIAVHGVLDAGTQLLSKPFTAGQLTRKIREVLQT